MGFTFMQATSTWAQPTDIRKLIALICVKLNDLCYMKCANIERLDRNQGNGASLSYIVAVGMGDHSTY
ncbi:MAG: hypothetical protein BMS9Abin18_0195 [Zetaproteobacteria bacterium]|nr:MAG: hypothetical protein BMS9Abin18_0195 [Zetaproteobacteria bacterium]